jgi:release factor glutamine methyltransferase
MTDMNEKELILTSLLDCRRVDIYTDPPCLSPSQERKFQEILKCRQEGEPLQYLLGETEFMGLPFYVNPSVLIPRPETESLVQIILHLYAQATRFFRIADLGTGSGNIAVSLAKHLNNVYIKAIDISWEALLTAEHNAKRNGVSGIVDFQCQDIFNLFDTANFNDRYDLIVSNPPYISRQDMRLLPRDVQHEPFMALFGGEDGLEFYRTIIAKAPMFLNDSGIIALEIGEEQRAAISGMFAIHERDFYVHFIKDLAGKDRFVVAQKFPATKKEEILKVYNMLKQ